MDHPTMIIAHGLRPLRGRAAHVPWANFCDPFGVLPCACPVAHVTGLEKEILVMLKDITIRAIGADPEGGAEFGYAPNVTTHQTLKGSQTLEFDPITPTNTTPKGS